LVAQRSEEEKQTDLKLTEVTQKAITPEKRIEGAAGVGSPRSRSLVANTLPTAALPSVAAFRNSWRNFYEDGEGLKFRVPVGLNRCMIWPHSHNLINAYWEVFTLETVVLTHK
jgi:hypothetical protein